MDDIQALVRNMKHLADLAANIADRLDGHTVTIHRGQAVKVKSVERPHRVDTIAAPHDVATIPVARLSSICRDFQHNIESGLAVIPKGML
jgi:hypothetical protein